MQAVITQQIHQSLAVQSPRALLPCIAHSNPTAYREALCLPLTSLWILPDVCRYSKAKRISRTMMAI